MSGFNKLHTIEYRNFQPVAIRSCEDWCFDGKYPKNMLHHIMSLRWIYDVKDKVVRSEIINDFIAFHGTERKKSKFYLGRTADHCASIRLKVLLKLVAGDCAVNDNCSYFDLISCEINKTLESCIEGETYKEGHNHGLMVDLSLIDAIDKGILDCYRKDILKVVPDRVLRQIGKIFSQDGACREHSISYQEYNLNILHDVKKALEDKKSLYSVLDELLHKVNSIYESVKNESKKLLGYALVKGQYMPLGDSPSQPKGRILKKVYGHEDPEIALSPYSKIYGYYFSRSAGFFLCRMENYSIGFTASWHSRVHKQNDDLSVVIYDKNGDPLVFDGGYSGAISGFDQRSEKYHSTFMPLNCEWEKRDKPKNGFSELSLVSDSFEAFVVSGRHNRVIGVILSREIHIGKDYIIIKDFSDKKVPLIHRFIFSKTKTLIPFDQKNTFSANEVLFSFSSACKYLRSEGEFILNDKRVDSDFFDVIAESGFSTKIIFR